MQVRFISVITLLKKLMLINSTEEFKNEHENHNKYLNNVMLNILNETTKMKECLSRLKENITKLESISVCSAGVEKSILKVMKWTNLEIDSVKPHSSVRDVYHPGINDPGEIQRFKSIITRTRKLRYVFWETKKGALPNCQLPLRF